MFSLSWQFVLWWWLFPPWHLVNWTPLLEQLRGYVQCWESWTICWYRIHVHFCHWSSSETHRGWCQDWQPGPVSALVLCGRGGQITDCWCKATPLVGKHTESAVWGLCWKRLAPVRSSASLPPLSNLENWLPFGTCLWLWRLLRAGAPFQRTGLFFVCLFCRVLVWGFLGWFVWFFVVYFSCQYCLGHVWSHFNHVFPVMTWSYVWVESLDRQWYHCMGEKEHCSLSSETQVGLILASLILAVSKTKRDWYKLLTRSVMKRCILWLQSRWANS